MNIRGDGFEWGRREYSQMSEAWLSLEEIEGFFRSKIFVAPDVKHSEKEERFLAVGYSSDGKPMFVAFTLRGNLIRPISLDICTKRGSKL
jgi:uncharacterized DUF497 family protein